MALTFKGTVELIAFLFFASLSAAQSLNFNTPFRFSYENGLTSASAFCISQSHDDRIWVGTENGLCVLKSGKFERFNLANDELPVMVLGLYPTKDSGLIVVGNEPSVIIKISKKGQILKKFQLETGKFNGSLLLYDSVKEEVIYSDWRHIYKWNGQYAISLANIQGTGLKSLSIGQEGQVFINKESGFYAIEDNKEKLVSNTNVHTSLFIPNKQYLLSNGKLFSLESGQSIIRTTWSYSLGTDPIKPICELNGRIWFAGVLHGLFVVERDSVRNIAPQIGCRKVQFTCVFKDRRGNIWCGTNGEGLVMLRQSIVENSFLFRDLRNRSISKIDCAGNGLIYILSKNDAYFYTGNKLSKLHIMSTGGSTIASLLYCMNFINGNLIIGVNDNVNYIKVAVNDSIAGVLTFASSLAHNDSLIIVGSWGGNGVVAYEDVTMLGLKEKINNTIGYGRTNDIILLDTGYLCATDLGMWYGNYKNGDIHQMSVELGYQGRFNSVVKRKDDSLFCSTGNSVFKWDGQAWQPVLIFEKRTINMYINKLVCDAANRLWVGTESGLVMNSNSRLATYTVKNGLLSDQIRSLFIDEENFLWIGTSEGANRINLNTFRPKEFQCQFNLHFSNLTSDSISYYFQSMEIPYEDNTFSVILALDNYNDLLPITYRYRLNNEGHKWQLTNSPKINFHSLDPGEYTLQLAARSSGTYWSSTTEYKFQILLPIYMKWQFYLALFIVSIIVFYIIYHLRMRAVQRVELEKRNIDQKINELQIMAHNAGMNPHFIFNSLNSIQHFLLPLKNIQAFEFVSNLAKLIRINMDALGKKSVNLKEEIERTELYLKLEMKRLNYKHNYIIRNNLGASISNISIPPMLIQPLAENSIWHGIASMSQGGFIEIILEQQDRWLQISVIDNGIGYKLAQKHRDATHKSVGLSLTMERLKYHHPENQFEIEEIHDTDGNVKGTKATIRLNIGYIQ